MRCCCFNYKCGRRGCRDFMWQCPGRLHYREEVVLVQSKGHMIGTPRDTCLRDLLEHNAKECSVTWHTIIVSCIKLLTS